MKGSFRRRDTFTPLISYLYPRVSLSILIHLSIYRFLHVHHSVSISLSLHHVPPDPLLSLSHHLYCLAPSLSLLIHLSPSVSQYLSMSHSFYIHPLSLTSSLSLSFLLYTLSTPQSSSLVYNFFIFLSLNGFLSIPSPSHTRTSMPVFVSELRSVLRFSTSDSSEHHGEVLVTVSRQQCVCAALQDSHGAEMRCLCGG